MKDKVRNTIKTAVSLAAVLQLTVSLSPLKTARVLATDTQHQLDERKLEVAKHLTDWMQDQLANRNAIVAVVSRKGGNDVKSRDFTGMAHSGLAVYDPRAQTWILYQIINQPHDHIPTARLWKSAPLDFFYGQTGYEENALILIPDTETQQRLYESILTRRAYKLAFTQKYNLLSRYDSSDSLNCNKWILMTIAAARSDDYDAHDVLRIIHNGFDPGTLHLGFLAREVARRKPNVRSSELPDHGPVLTVTPQSLYESDLFQERIFADSSKNSE